MRLIAIAIIFIFTGCMTSEKAKHKLDKIDDKYPELISEICSVEYPCLPKKADTLWRTEYDLIEVECPDGQIPFTSRDSTDTVYIIKYNEKRITKEIRIPCESQIITMYLEDSAKITDISNRLDICTKDYAKAKKEASRYKRYTKILSILLVLIILGLYLVRKWFKKQ